MIIKFELTEAPLSSCFELLFVGKIIIKHQKQKVTVWLDITNMLLLVLLWLLLLLLLLLLLIPLLQLLLRLLLQLLLISQHIFTASTKKKKKNLKQEWKICFNGNDSSLAASSHGGQRSAIQQQPLSLFAHGLFIRLDCWESYHLSF